ncbi:MAG: hypothetical protein ACOXZH_03235 [Bacteroidales bacterium]|jgi:hypothetical protein
MKVQIYFLIILFIAVSCLNKNKSVYYDPNADTVKSVVEHTFNDLPSVFLSPDFEGIVEVFDIPPYGKKVKELKNNMEEGNIVMFDLLQKNDSMYYVLAYSGLTNEILATGWIHKKNKLSICFLAYDRDLVIYRNVNDRSDKILSDKEYLVTDVEVIDYEGEWLKIKFKYKGIFHVGWLPPEMQCANPYTTCS